MWAKLSHLLASPSHFTVGVGVTQLLPVVAYIEEKEDYAEEIKIQKRVGQKIAMGQNQLLSKTRTCGCVRTRYRLVKSSVFFSAAEL